MRFSEMDSLSKIFDRVGRMLQNFKQQAQASQGVDESMNQGTASSASITTPSPCQPYPLQGTSSSQSSLASSSYTAAAATAMASEYSPQSHSISGSTQQNTSPSISKPHSHHQHYPSTYSQHQQAFISPYQTSSQQQQHHYHHHNHHHHHSIQHLSNSSQNVPISSYGSQASAHYHSSHSQHNPHSSSVATTNHTTYSHHPQSSTTATITSSTGIGAGVGAGFSSHHHHSYQPHPMLVASSSQPLMPATSPHYSHSIALGGVTSSGASSLFNCNSAEHRANNGGASTTSNSPSSCSAISPAPAQSFSAVQTPDSPVGFPRRQLSLTVGQRSNHVTGKLHLDLNRKPKNSGSQGSIFANTNDVINQHSLSPRPRPRNLGLSNSHDNMFKPSREGCNSGSSSSGTGGIGNMGIPGNGQTGNFCLINNGTAGMINAQSSRQCLSRECLAPLSFNTPTNCLGNKNIQYNPPPPRTLKDEYAKNNQTIEVNGLKFENIVEKDFRKISELGNGSFGQVEKMLHIPSKIEFAVKKMRRSGNHDDNKHIINDLDLLRKCTNFPHIVQCCGYYIMETEVWIFMELMTICFDRLLKRLTEPIPEKIIGKIAVATVEALNYLKIKLSIIHRDIKPSNILINREGVIKLCDFGISGRLIDSKAHSRSVGCVAYMAPERIQPDITGTYDIRSDVWSLGITLIEIATGKFPYQGWKSDFELLSKVIQDEPPTLPKDGGFSIQFQNFITACLIKEYKARPKYNDLMLHSFFLHYKRDTQVDVADWFNRAYPPEE